VGVLLQGPLFQIPTPLSVTVDEGFIDADVVDMLFCSLALYEL